MPVPLHCSLSSSFSSLNWHLLPFLPSHTAFSLPSYPLSLSLPLSLPLSLSTWVARERSVSFLPAMASTKRKEEEEPEKRVKQQGSAKLYSKMLSKEAALAVPSFRVYYGVASAGSVPFLWESQPGTPKSSPSAAALPPLTPPPSYSYYAAGGKGGSKKGGANGSASRRWPGGVIALFRRPRRSRTSPCSSSSLSWSSSSSTASSMSPVFTVQSSPAARGSHQRAFSAGDVFQDAAAAPSSCFGMEREYDRRVVKGCGVAVAVRNALATVVGHRSAAEPPARRPS